MTYANTNISQSLVAGSSHSASREEGWLRRRCVLGCTREEVPRGGVVLQYLRGQGSATAIVCFQARDNLLSNSGEEFHHFTKNLTNLTKYGRIRSAIYKTKLLYFLYCVWFCVNDSRNSW